MIDLYSFCIYFSKQMKKKCPHPFIPSFDVCSIFWYTFTPPASFKFYIRKIVSIVNNKKKKKIHFEKFFQTERRMEKKNFFSIIFVVDSLLILWVRFDISNVFLFVLRFPMQMAFLWIFPLFPVLVHFFCFCFGRKKKFFSFFSRVKQTSPFNSCLCSQNIKKKQKNETNISKSFINFRKKSPFQRLGGIEFSRWKLILLLVI